MYANEHRVKHARTLSDRIEKATRLNLYKRELDSENYQVMNYGIGGTISGHVDSSGNVVLPNANKVARFIRLVMSAQ